MSAVPVPVSCFVDYACPYCYIASVELQRVGDRYPLHIRWRFLETQPQTPAQGRPFDEQRLGAIPPERIAQQNSIAYSSPAFIANSRRALLLAQATLERRPDRFADLHLAIFQSMFVDGRNIGEPNVLTALAEQHGVSDLIDAAWDSPEFLGKLLKHVEAAQALSLASVPSLAVASRVFTGVEAVRTLEQALEQADQPSTGR